MRVISGTARGHRLVAPKSSATRPVLDQVKEAIFNILFDVEGTTVLDLFAGSGAMGIEALSRGAAHATFVDHLPQATAAITRNLEHCRLAERATVMTTTVFRAVRSMTRKRQQCDLLFVDPPYERDLVNEALGLLVDAHLLKEAARIVVEHHPKEPVLPPPGLALTDQRRYGQTLVSFLTKTANNEI